MFLKYCKHISVGCLCCRESDTFYASTLSCHITFYFNVYLLNVTRSRDFFVEYGLSRRTFLQDEGEHCHDKEHHRPTFREYLELGQGCVSLRRWSFKAKWLYYRATEGRQQENWRCPEWRMCRSL